MGGLLVQILLAERITELEDSIAKYLLKDFPVQLIDPSTYELKESPHKNSILVIDAEAFADTSFAKLSSKVRATFWIGNVRPKGFESNATLLPRSKLATLSALIAKYRAKEECYSYRDLTLNLHSLSVTIADRQHFLPLKELQILKAFLAYPGELIPKVKLKEAVWGKQAISLRTLDSHISRLRKKLAAEGFQIENRYGDGYIFS